MPARSCTRSDGGENSASAISAASSRDGVITGAVSNRARTARSAAAVIGSWHPVSSSWLPIAQAYAWGGCAAVTARTAAASAQPRPRGASGRCMVTDVHVRRQTSPSAPRHGRLSGNRRNLAITAARRRTGRMASARAGERVAVIPRDG
jgi:hypothetical protein